MKPVKVILTLVLLGVAATAGFLAGRNPNLGRGDEPANRAFVRVHGNVEIRDARLAFNGAEHVASVMVEEGDRVAAGDLLATLRTDRLADRLREAEAQRDAQRAVVARLEHGSRPQEIERARAELRAAAARAANAGRDAERLRLAASSGASSRQALDDAEARVETEQATVAALEQTLALLVEGPRAEDVAEARARLAADEAAIASLHTELDDARLVAPTDGIVQSRLLEPGEFASPERPVVLLALLDRKWVRAWLPEPALGRVALGMRAEVHGDAYPDERFPGWVGFISPVAEFTPKTVQTTELRPQLVYEVRIFVEDPNDRLRLGQPVTVDVDPEAPRRTLSTDGNDP